MQIQLKQSEIVTALKQYIVKQGINLAGKTVDVAFTAGRNGTGLSADISIEDSNFVVPDLDNCYTTAVISNVVQMTQAAFVDTPPVETKAEEPQAEAEAIPEVKAVQPSVSLFS